MKISKLQFNNLLCNIKLNISSYCDYVSISFDNNYFVIDGRYDLHSSHLDLDFYIDNSESELTDEQVNEIMVKVMSKVESIKSNKKEDIDIIRFGEVGY